MSRRPSSWRVLLALLVVVASPHTAAAELHFDDLPFHKSGFTEVAFEARDGNSLRAMIYRASGFEADVSPIWFVMHGAGRSAGRYIDTSAPVAERYGAMAIAIEFPKSFYPRSSDYTLGVTTHGAPDANALDEGRWRTDGYLYTELERVFDGIRDAIGGKQSGYYLYGHSAGAQFVHRLLTFMPQARVLGAVAANSGWYTLPVWSDEAAFQMPYGLSATPVSADDIAALLGAPLTLLIGESDLDTPEEDPQLRGTSGALAQGVTRVDRGRFYFATASAQASTLGTEFGWHMAFVPRARHRNADMIASGGAVLFGPSLCEPSAAHDRHGLQITEILAAPPRGDAGDTNRDGVRDHSDDEFVEIVNLGTAPMCLTGWTLADANRSVMHVFPLGAALKPGQAMIVFGGGIPQGDFGGAIVQWAAYGETLGLSRRGGVLTLRDVREVVAGQVSWGDCGGHDCVSDHWSGDLESGTSLVRFPGPHGQWALHRRVSTSPFSPGIPASDAEMP